MVLLIKCFTLNHPPTISYKILNPAGVNAQKDIKKVASVILDTSALDPELYRLGNTKAWL